MSRDIRSQEALELLKYANKAHLCELTTFEEFLEAYNKCLRCAPRNSHGVVEVLKYAIETGLCDPKTFEDFLEAYRKCLRSGSL